MEASDAILRHEFRINFMQSLRQLLANLLPASFAQGATSTAPKFEFGSACLGYKLEQSWKSVDTKWEQIARKV